MLELSPWLCLRVLCVVLIDDFDDVSQKVAAKPSGKRGENILGQKEYIQGLVLSFLVILNFLLPQSNLVYPLQR